MTQPPLSTSPLLRVDEEADDAACALGWGERIRALALHAVCWGLLALMVLPLLPPGLQSAAARGVASSAASGWALLPLDEVAASWRPAATEHRTCVPVCVHVDH